MQIKILLAIVFSLLVTVASAAQNDERYTSLVGEPKIQAQNTILWEVKHPNVEKPSYLLGTMHQIGNSFLDSLPKLKELLYASDFALFESIDPRDSLRAMLNRRPETLEWRRELRKSDVKFLDAYSKNWPVSISKLTPFELNIKLHQEFWLYTCKTLRPGDEWDHFDQYLIHLAKEKNVQVVGLETDNLQTKYINEMAPNYNWKKAKKDIALIVRNIKSSKRNSECEFARRYMNFELDYKFDEECIGPVMIRRNDLWLPIIVEHLEIGQSFIAVGVFHLYRKCGLIEQLRSIGYSVEPVLIKKSSSL